MILTLNAGSSSIKFAIYTVAPEPDMRLVGQVENIGADAQLIAEGSDPVVLGPTDHDTAVQAILQAVKPTLDGAPVTGVGHRIVHGGTEFGGPAELTAETMDKLTRLIPLAPLHQPHNLAAVRAIEEVFPDAVQIGCFDTAFHKGHPFVNDTFALPRRFYEEGVRRYGFHGLSYDYITGRMAQDYPDLARGRVVVAHLGNGTSMCAIRGGQSVGSTMGFSALDGLPMGTRCGQLDPGVLLYMMQQGMSASEISHMLYNESGMKGLSGLTHDMRTLLASGAARAHQAIDYYVFRIRRELGAMAAVMGGLDGLVFCGGIGENADEIRARVIDGLGFLGLTLDRQANAAHGPLISNGLIPALVIRTDEERIIARAVVRAVR